MGNDLSDTGKEIAVETSQSDDLDTGFEGQNSWFQTLSRAEKRFHILFYALAGLTGLLLVQLVWQIAAATAH